VHLLLQRSIGVGGTPLNTRLVPEGIGSVLGFRLRHGSGEGGEGSGEGGGRRRRKGQVVHKLMIRTDDAWTEHYLHFQKRFTTRLFGTVIRGPRVLSVE
jgi:hypothetical protein